MAEFCKITRQPAAPLAEVVASADIWDGPLSGALAELAQDGVLLTLSPERRILRLAAPVAEWAGALTEAGGRVIDMTHGWQPILLEGPGARALLARGIELNLDPAAFRPGQQIATLCARVPTLLCAETEERFTLLVATSYADWLFDWLTSVREPLAESGAVA